MFTKRAVIFSLVILSVVVFVLARRVAMPFVIAAGFAYVCNPVIKQISTSVRVNRTWSVVLFYVFLLFFLVVVTSWLVSQVIREVSEVSQNLSLNDISAFSQGEIKSLPEWSLYGQSFGFQSLFVSLINTLIFSASRIKESVLPAFTGAIGYLLQVLVFFIASFYFLKDGPHIFEKIMSKLPKTYEEDLLYVGRKLNTVLGGYLRGQILLIILMGAVSSLFLSLLGVRFAVTLGIITGFLEIIPFVGPVVAGGLAAGTAFITGNNRFGFDPATLMIVIITFYFIARQLEDYFVTPQVMGKLTRLHPLAVLFAVLAGGAIAGPIGFILGVPVAASLRVILEYTWGKADE